MATTVPETAQQQAWRLMLELFMLQRSQFMAAAQELGLAPQQAFALKHLEPDRPLTMGELAQALRCDNSNVTGIADRLESAGLVQRRPHERDRRVKTLVLTAEGERVRAAYMARMTTAPAAIALLPDADAQALLAIMQQALAAMRGIHES